MEVSHEEFEREKENFSKKKLAKMVSGLMEELEVMKKMYQELKDTKVNEATNEEAKVDTATNPEKQARPTFMYAEEDFGGAGYITSVLKDHPEISLNSSYVFSDPAEEKFYAAVYDVCFTENGCESKPNIPTWFEHDENVKQVPLTAYMMLILPMLYAAENKYLRLDYVLNYYALLGTIKSSTTDLLAKYVDGTMGENNAITITIPAEEYDKTDFVYASNRLCTLRSINIWITKREDTDGEIPEGDVDVIPDSVPMDAGEVIDAENPET